MTSKGSLSKALTFRVKQLSECHQKLQASLGAYIGQITGCAQAWIEKSEDRDQDKFVDITVKLDEAMMMLVEMTSNVENNLTGLPSGTAPTEATVQSTSDSPTQINALPQGLDASIHSLLEQLGTLKNVTDMVQELRTDLDSCKTQMDSLEGIRDSLSNITSHCGMLVHASSAQVKTRCEQFHASQSTQIQLFEKQLSEMQSSFSKTDSEMKDVAKFVNVFRKQFADSIRTLTEPEDQLPAVDNSAQIECQHQDNSLSDLDGQLYHLENVTDTTDDVVRAIREELAVLKTKNRLVEEQMRGESGRKLTHREEEMNRREEASLQMKSMGSTVSSQAPSVKVTEPSVTTWTGFCVQCLDDIEIGPWTKSIRWKVLSSGTSCGFDVWRSIFTAPVSGLYLVLLVHYQIGTKPTTVRVVRSGKGSWHERDMITNDTTYRDDYAVGQRYISMNAGDTFSLSVPTKYCRFQIPFFSCVLVS